MVTRIWTVHISSGPIKQAKFMHKRNLCHIGRYSVVLFLLVARGKLIALEQINVLFQMLDL